MYRADKFYGADRQVLANISLSFLPGAKIGVLGPNGAGKSTLLRIMAGREQPSNGIAELAPGASVGLLAQEPDSTPARTSRERRGRRRELRDLLDRFNAISAAVRRARRRLRRAARRAGEGAGRDRPPRRLDARRDARPRDGRVPPPRRRPRVDHLSGGEKRRVALCRLLLPRPTCSCSTSRRTTSTPSRSPGWSASSAVHGHGRRGHPRPLLPRQRRRLDPRARSRQGHPVQGQLLGLARAEAGAPRIEEKTESARRRTLARELEWVRMSPKARQAKSKAACSATSSCSRRSRT